MRGHLASTDWNWVFNSNKPEEVCSEVTEIICDTMDIYIPGKTITKKPGDKAWFNDKCKQAVIKKRNLFRKMKQENTQEHRENFVKARQ